MFLIFYLRTSFIVGSSYHPPFSLSLIPKHLTYYSLSDFSFCGKREVLVWGHIAAISQEKTFQFYTWIWTQELQEDGVAGGVDVHFQAWSFTWGWKYKVSVQYITYFSSLNPSQQTLPIGSIVLEQTPPLLLLEIILLMKSWPKTRLTLKSKKCTYYCIKQIKIKSKIERSKFWWFFTEWVSGVLGDFIFLSKVS